MIPFRRDGDLFVARFADEEIAVLIELVEQELALLAEVHPDAPLDDELASAGIGGSSAPPPDPALARLLPDAYRDDPEASSEYRRLTESALVSRKVAAARSLRDDLGTGVVELDEDSAQVWLRAINDLRLIIASRLGIEHDDDEGEGDEVMQDVYRWLAGVQSSLLEAMGA